MAILKVLENKCKISDNKFEKKLFTLTENLIDEASGNIKRIGLVMNEYDTHDKEHSEKVIDNMANLIGEKNLENLSCCELFLLATSAYLHDCAMAPSDWELNLLKLTEGTYDGGKAFSSQEAKEFIDQNKGIIYGKAELNGDIPKWIFSNQNKNEFINYLAATLIDYQNFRNGKIEKINEAKDYEFEKINDSIRTDFIRATHHTRAEQYICNTEQTCFRIIGNDCVKKLVKDLSQICRAHGESMEYVERLKKDATYFAKDKTNLQFVAMILRLADIIHFSYDRAPLSTRNAKIFESDYSYRQWAVKSGVSYYFGNGEIGYNAYFEKPEYYYMLQNYINWIDEEISNFNNIKNNWDEKYRIALKKVLRDGITHDDSFMPKPGMMFTLNQSRIIELLMGVGLYKDPYACLRELYQNSLDACRCMVAKETTSTTQVKGEIEFGIKEDSVGKYLYCYDNGIGMTKDIIENYLLKIGNSYYKSSDFFREQASWGNKFTPTSQFGIGILSCFMIGDKIEITTKTSNERECISCLIDGMNEIFYYKNASAEDSELINRSGTIVKIYLKEPFSNELNNELVVSPEFMKLVKVLQSIKISILITGFINNDVSWKQNIYSILNDYILIIPDSICVKTRTQNDITLNIYNKPCIPLFNDKTSEIQLQELLKRYKFDKYYLAVKSEIKDIKSIIKRENFKAYNIDIKETNVNYHAILFLPMHKESLKIEHERYFCVDGVATDIDEYSTFSETKDIEEVPSVINFINNKPLLSVDRKTILGFNYNTDNIDNNLALKILNKIVSTTNRHIIDNNIFDKISYDYVWDYTTKKFGYKIKSLFTKINMNLLSDIVIYGVCDGIDGRTVGDVLSNPDLRIDNYNYLDYNAFFRHIIRWRMQASKRITIDNNGTLILNGLKSNIKDYVSFVEYDSNIFENYDLITKYSPLRLPRKPDKKIDRLLFGDIYDKDSRFVHPDVGIVSYAFSDNKSYEYVNYSDSSDLNFDCENLGNKILYVFLSPQSDIDTYIKTLKASDSDFIKGLKEGWSVLLTSKPGYLQTVLPGKHPRKDLLKKLGENFWRKYGNEHFEFLDGTPAENPFKSFSENGE